MPHAKKNRAASAPRPRSRREPFIRAATALGVAAWVVLGAPAAQAQTPFTDPPPAVALAVPPTRGSTPARTWADAVFIDVAASFVPYANDVPLMVGIGVRFAGRHELYARAGYIPVGDDRRYGFGCGGYRVALRPRKIVRPIFGAMVAGLPASCGHDAQGQPQCTAATLFIFAGTAGVRFEPVPWLGIFSALTLGTDSYPNPFGMLELGASLALPQS